MFPLACIYFRPLIYSLCIVGILYASLTAIRQVDIKRVIAYSSVAHMNVVVLGIFSFNFIGIQGSIFLMCAHGITSGALFFLVGSLYDRCHTRLLKYYSGLVLVMPAWCCYFFLFTIANFAAPGSINFVGELLVFIGIFCQNTFVGFCASLSAILSVIYCLLLFNRICFGTFKSTTFYRTTS